MLRQTCASLMIAGLWLGAFGCSGPAAQRVREVTYPREFTYVPKKQVHDQMERMATMVARINQVLRERGPSSQAEVVAALEALEAAAIDLDVPSSLTNHPLLHSRMDAFVSDIKRARASAAASPPNYFLAGSVAGACMYCHGSTL